VRNWPNDSTYDDPGLPCALLPLSFFWSEHAHAKNRWTMCAADVCFTNELLRCARVDHQVGTWTDTRACAPRAVVGNERCGDGCPLRPRRQPHTMMHTMRRQFFLNGKVLPVERGGGVNQASISVAARALGEAGRARALGEAGQARAPRVT
jgi:hypothetical protein